MLKFIKQVVADYNFVRLIHPTTSRYTALKASIAYAVGPKY